MNVLYCLYYLYDPYDLYGLYDMYELHDMHDLCDRYDLQKDSSHTITRWELHDAALAEHTNGKRGSTADDLLIEDIYV